MALLGMLYLAFRFVDLASVMAGFAQVSLAALFSFFLLMLLSKFFYALRWYLICTSGLGLRNVSNLFLVRTNLLGEFVGIAMPSSLGGEAVRILKLGARTGTTAQATASVVADRLMGIIGMGLVALALLPRLGVSIVGRLPLSASGLWGAMALGAGGVGVAIFWWRRRGRPISLSRAVRQIEFSFLRLFILLLLSVSGHLVFASGYYLLFREIQPFPFLTVVALMLTAQLARSIPISLLGIGLSEGSVVVLANLVGMDPETALAIVVIGLGARFVFAIGGLLIELSCDGKTFLNTMTRRMDAGLETSQ